MYTTFSMHSPDPACPKDSSIVMLLALLFAFLSFALLSEVERYIDEAVFVSLSAKEMPMLRVSELKLDAAENLWRDAISKHPCNQKSDWLYANCAVKLGDILMLKAKHSETPAPAEVEHLYRQAAVGFHNLNATFENAAALECLGSYFENQGKSREAEEYYKKSIVGYKTKFGGFCFYSQEVTTDLFEMFTSQKRYGEAEALLKEELKGLKARKSDYPIADGMIQFQIGQTLYWQGRYAEAEPYLKTSLAHGSSCPGLVTGYVAAVAEKLGKNEEAEKEYKNVVKFEREMQKRGLLGTHSFSFPENLASAIESLGTFYVGQNRLSDAEPLLKEALQLRKAELSVKDVFGPTPQQRLEMFNSVRDDLAELYRKQGREKEAKALSITTLRRF